MRTLLQVARTAPSAEYFKGYRDGLRWDIRGDSEPLPEDEPQGDPGADTAQIAQLIVTALEEGYTGGVEALLSYARDGDTIYGRFRDGAKTFGYALNDGQISYWLLRGQGRTDSLLQSPVWRTDKASPKGQKSKNAGKGVKCGRGYISPDKNCKVEPSPEAKEAIAKAAELIDPFSPENNPSFPKGAVVETPPRAKKARSKPKPAPEPEFDDFEVLDLEPVDDPPPKKPKKTAKKPKPVPDEKPKAERKPKKEKDEPSPSSIGAGWKPTMTEDEAKEYTKDSYFQTPFYHGTSKAAAESIQSQGVETKKIGRGQFGAGFYLAGSEFEADMYANGFMSSNPDGSANTSQAATMTVRVNIRNPKVFRTSRQFAKFKEKLGLNFHDNDPKTAKTITDALRAKGFDGVHIKDRDYVVAFDREQVVVTNSREAKYNYK